MARKAGSYRIGYAIHIAERIFKKRETPCTVWQATPAEIDAMLAAVNLNKPPQPIRKKRLSSMLGVRTMKRHPKEREENAVMNFATALDCGVSPKNAITEYPAAGPRDITKERLTWCRDGGLTAEEISKGFDCSMATIYNKCSKFNVRLTDRRARADNPEPTVDTITPKSTVMAITPTPTDNLFVHTFGCKQPEKSMVTISACGEVRLLGVKPSETRMIIRFTQNFDCCRLDPQADGMNFREKGRSYIASCKPVAKAMALAGINLPARYELDEHMVGNLIHSSVIAEGA